MVSLKGGLFHKIFLASIWLDIANTYATIHHRLLFFALESYDIDPHWISPIKMYYSGIYRHCFSQYAPSSWHQHFKEVFAVWTLSIILFLAGINVVIEYTLASSACKFLSTGSVALPLVGAFMDALNLISSSASGTQNLLIDGWKFCHGQICISDLTSFALLLL